MATCQGVKKDGTPCGAPVSEGDNFCHNHVGQAPFGEDSACGHENVHHIPQPNDKDYLACEKEPGHEGNHGGLYLLVERSRDGEIYREEYVWGEWTDEAGIPPEEIKPRPLGKRTRFDVYDPAWEPQ